MLQVTVPIITLRKPLSYAEWLASSHLSIIKKSGAAALHQHLSVTIKFAETALAPTQTPLRLTECMYSLGRMN